MGSQNDRRLFSLDLLRGLDMFYLSVVSVILPHVFGLLGLGPGWKHFFCTHPWEGFTLYDLIMPLFIFMSGAAVPLALERRLDDAGRPGRAFHAHVWSRFALLWVLGMLTQGNLQTFDLHQISFYNNTLQTIAVGYVATAYAMTLRNKAVRVAIPLVLTVVYGLLVHFLGDYTKDGNITQIVELKILGALMPADNTQMAGVAHGGYTWYLPSMIFPVIAMAGAFSTSILRRADLSERRRAGLLAGFGAVSLATGWLLAFAGVKMVKHIFTVSFTLQAIGWSALALAALYVVADVWRLRKGTGLLIAFGRCSLAAYLCETVFHQTCQMAGDRVCGGLARFFPENCRGLVHALIFAGVVITVVLLRYRTKQKGKQSCSSN